MFDTFIKSPLFLFFATFLLACGGTKKTITTIAAQQQPERPVETYLPNSVADISPSVSTVSIPIRLSRTEIEHLINNKLNGVLYENYDESVDGVKLKIMKANWIQLSFDGLSLTYRVPLSIWFYKTLLDNSVTGQQGISGDGELTMTFKTNLNIKPDWTVEPYTEFIGSEWVRPLRVSGINVKYIADLALNKNRAMLTTTIDQQIKSVFQLRQSMSDAWNVMQQPVKVSEDYRMWVKLTPQSIAMTPFRSEGDMLMSNIGVNTLVDVAAGQTQPYFRGNTQLPPFQIGYGQNSEFNINMATDIPMQEAQTLANSFARGMVFEPAKGKKIQITNLELFGQNDKIVINAYFSGSYNGSLYFIGRPVFNATTNAIEMQDIDYDLNTKNFLLRGANWLFNRQILDKVRESCIFPLNENIASFKNEMNTMLANYQLNPNVSVQGQVDNIQVQNVVVQSSGIKVMVGTKGKLALDVRGLDKF